ncbi:DoxX-like protein [Kribbella steppae]|uniref:DoxX-like protein n=1 Tax=Kribbella steppae TaxID=2512223 RepID=A0A4V2RY30_9ACTN|nr:DoxX family protein [Kribbella steppae]TCO17265.1 DoxX-like protein [Kribbella steppae]
MTHIDIRPTDRPATGKRSARARRVAVLVIQVALAAQFIAGGASKLLGSEQIVTMFDDIGAGHWLRLLVGILEIAGGVGLLVPRLTGLAATGLIALMAGAVVTNIFVLGIAPVMPLVFGILAGVVAASRRVQLVALVRR